MFRGFATLSIDVKGRITIPQQYRTKIMDEANGEMVLTIDTEDRCLLLYPLPPWQELEERLQELPHQNQSARRVRRLMIGHAVELEFDRHGRIFLPQLLREYAGLDQEVVIVGQGKNCEIWGEAQWQLGRNAWLAGEIEEESSTAVELF